MQMVDKYRIGEVIPWTKIVPTMPGRYKAQLYNRYMFSLKPTIKRDKFTVEEDCVLMAAVQKYETNFKLFPPNLLPGRNLVQIRNRYNNVLQYNGKARSWTPEDDQKLLDLVEKIGTKNWAQISTELQGHSRLSCRTRYTTIVKFLEKHPEATVADVTRKKRKTSSTVTTDNWMETIIQEKKKREYEAASQAKRKRKASAPTEKTAPPEKALHLIGEPSTNYTLTSEGGIYRLIVRDENELLSSTADTGSEVVSRTAENKSR